MRVKPIGPPAPESPKSLAGPSVSSERSPIASGSGKWTGTSASTTALHTESKSPAVSSLRRKQLLVAVLAAVIGLVGVACGDDAGDDASGGTTSAPAGPPCFGLARVDALPEWADGLSFGERHEFNGGFTDLSGRVGCEVDEGVLSVDEESPSGMGLQAYVDGCDTFESSDIPPEELRPAPDDAWICFAPGGEPGTQVIAQKEG